MLSDKKKILMLATTAAMIEQFNKDNILILEEMGYEIHVAGNWLEGNPISKERLEEFKDWLGVHHGKWFHITATRRPTDLKNNGKAFRAVVDLIKKYRYDFIHCHTPIGSVIGRLAAIKTNTKVIYTAHGFHFFKGAPLKNWILYFPVEWLCSWMTDVLITINTEDYRRAKKHLHAKRTEYIPGVGVDVEKFADCNVDKREKCKELGISVSDFVIISVGELNLNKNHEIIIKAIAKLNNPHVKYIICGQGELAEYLTTIIKQNNLEKQVFLLGFRNDIKELLCIADLFAFPSRREGLSMSLMEAMACGLPIVCGDIRGNNDLVEEGRGGYLIAKNRIAQYADAIRNIMNGGSKRETMRKYSRTKIKSFSLEVVRIKMGQIYECM